MLWSKITTKHTFIGFPTDKPSLKYIFLQHITFCSVQSNVGLFKQSLGWMKMAHCSLYTGILAIAGPTRNQVWQRIRDSAPVEQKCVYLEQVNEVRTVIKVNECLQQPFPKSRLQREMMWKQWLLDSFYHIVFTSFDHYSKTTKASYWLNSKGWTVHCTDFKPHSSQTLNLTHCACRPC